MKTELVPIISSVVVFAAAMLNIFFVVRNAKKTTFTGSVTSSRIKYIQDIREAISKFCGLAYAYNAGLGKLTPQEASAIRKEADSLRYLIRLYLNPEDKFWDNKIMLFCDEVINNTDKSMDDLHSAIENLVVITQYLLKLEWQGIKEEAKSGVLSEKRKKLLYDSYVKLYENHVADAK